MPSPTSTGACFLQVKIPTKVRKELRMYAAEHDMTIQDIMIEALSLWAKEKGLALSLREMPTSKSA